MGGLWNMFQSLALRGLLLFVIANLVKAEVFVDDDIDAVIIQAGDSADDDDGGEQNARQGRQFGFPFQNLGVAPASTVPLSRACKTTAGVAGYCAKYSHCYPYYFASEDTPSSAYGSKDACTYSDEKTSYQGVCCITSQAQTLRQVAWGQGAWGQQWGQPQQQQWRQPAQQQWGQPVQQQWGKPAQQQWRQPAQQQWGQPAQRKPQWGPPAGGLYPGQQAQYPAGVFPGGIQGGGLYPGIPQQGLYPGIPGQGAQGIYPQRPQVPQIPQRPQVPQPVPQVPQVPVQQPQPAPVQPQPSNPVVSEPVGSQCGVGGKAILYDENGEDEEAVRRTKSEFRIKGGWPAEKHEWPWIASIWNN